MKVFFDTNILIDAFSSRDELSQFSEQCYLLALSKQIKGYITSNQLMTFYYVFSKSTNKEFAIECLNQIINNFEVVPFSKFNVLHSIESEFIDIEDGAQDDCSKEFCCNYLITRNIKHFDKSKNVVCTPKEFLKLYSALQNA